MNRVILRSGRGVERNFRSQKSRKIKCPKSEEFFENNYCKGKVSTFGAMVHGTRRVTLCTLALHCSTHRTQRHCSRNMPPHAKRLPIDENEEVLVVVATRKGRSASVHRMHAGTRACCCNATSCFTTGREVDRQTAAKGHS